ncbi:hypothetical protein [Nonomuraea rubra]|uniref:WD40 repeat domain-containing protein n=1 Tax=Nonomuraea rubra TaxID=46180 RepID=A0A7X0NLH1_9ACTN|nr:hypothetical protein [Nonomuraea rubra]MBB6545598.1 hypothetical protein [Nonomuraea rubra]
MTRFTDELRLLAEQAPDVDLAERAVRGARRRRAASFGSVVAALVALALGVPLLTASPGGDTISGTVTDVLPGQGVDRAAYAYYDFCGRQWDYRKNTHTFAGQECAQWRLVTRGGESFRMPDAVSVFTEQTAGNYMNTGAPLVISSDGRKVAYYRESDQRYAVRDLETGAVLLTPQTFPRDTMVKGAGLVRLSPDGRFLAMTGRGWPIVVVDMESGQVTDVPPGWYIQRIGNGGSPVVLGDDRGRLGLLKGGEVQVVPSPADDLRRFGEPSADGRVLPFLDGATQGMNSRPPDTIVTLDVTTGRELTRAKLRDAPEGFEVSRIGGWLSANEVMVTGNPPFERGKDGTPTLGETTYAVDVNSGRVRKLESYTYRAWAGDLVLPGF